ncbi:MAG TPA: hypothetical protein VGS41_11030 [Chthonomonadales bacterium]|nr:hypothetical protein [Chthonomonadales bacterium]
MNKASRLPASLFATALAAALVACGHPNAGYASHGAYNRATRVSIADRRERWSVKTGEDSQASSVSMRPTVTTVSALTSAVRPGDLPLQFDRSAMEAPREGPIERTLFTVDADVLRYKWESEDGDYHLVIADHDAQPGSPTMIAEIPDPAIVEARSPWRDAIAQARSFFKAHYSPMNRFTRSRTRVQITGVGFFDFSHRQSGAAPNGLELHPVLALSGEQPEGNAPAPSGGQVWVNTRTGVYWRAGTRWYGKTRQGRYMPEQQAIRAQYRAAGGDSGS